MEGYKQAEFGSTIPPKYPPSVQGKGGKHLNNE